MGTRHTQRRNISQLTEGVHQRCNYQCIRCAFHCVFVAFFSFVLHVRPLGHTIQMKVCIFFFIVMLIWWCDVFALVESMGTCRWVIASGNTHTHTHTSYIIQISQYHSRLYASKYNHFREDIIFFIGSVLYPGLDSGISVMEYSWLPIMPPVKCSFFLLRSEVIWSHLPHRHISWHRKNH